MAKLKATPKNYVEALTTLNGKQSMRLGNNTYLEQRKQPGDGLTERIAVRLHNTDVVVFYPSGRVTLHTGGHRTVTTKERINHHIKGRVYQKAHVWQYVANRGELGIDWANPIEFAERMNVA
jgi:hypothetical protein